MTIESIGDIEQTIKEIANLSRSLEQQVVINFSASNLAKSDFTDVTAHKGKFEGRALRGSDFRTKKTKVLLYAFCFFIFVFNFFQADTFKNFIN